MPEQPHPHLIIADSDSVTTPLSSFDLLVIVEPDAEEWMNLDEAHFPEILDDINQGVADELFPDEDDLVRPPHVVYVKISPVEYFYRAVDALFVDVLFDTEDNLTHLGFYARGLAAAQPRWRVVVIGATFENEVMRIANLFQEAGLGTTVLTRYCLSEKAFINLDELLSGA